VADDRRAAHAAPDHDAKAGLARVVPHRLQADVVQQQGDRSPAAPLIAILNLRGSQLNSGWNVDHWRRISASGPRVQDLVGRDAGEVVVVMLRTQLPLVWIACISTSASSARMSGTSSRRGQLSWRFWRVLKWPVAAVVLARDVARACEAAPTTRAVRNRDPQHRRVALDVEAVAQPQRPELVLRELAREEAPRLVAELRDALGDEGVVVGSYRYMVALRRC
jgi:hypothetical protein